LALRALRQAGAIRARAHPRRRRLLPGTGVRESTLRAAEPGLSPRTPGNGSSTAPPSASPALRHRATRRGRRAFRLTVADNVQNFCLREIAVEHFALFCPRIRLTGIRLLLRAPALGVERRNELVRVALVPADEDDRAPQLIVAAREQGE